MDKFDECIIHIGTEKTGTKTLQEFFYINKSILSKNSIFFPKTFGEKNHIKLTAYACADHKKDDLRKTLRIISIPLIKNFRHEIEISFKREIENQSCKRLLLSGEHMQSRLTSIEEIQFLKNFLDKFVTKYKIIVYLRSQIEMAISLYSTLLKSGGIRKTVLPDIKEKNLYYNHEKLLDRWSDVFGSECIVPRIFSRNDLLDNDIKKDFISFLGLNWNDFKDVENFNESLNEDAQKFFLRINKFLPRFIGDKPNKAHEVLVKIISDNNIGKGSIPTRMEAENFFNIFADSNERVREKWFPKRKKLFEIDFSIYPEKKNFNKNDNFGFKKFAELWLKKSDQPFSSQVKNEINNALINADQEKQDIKTKFKNFFYKGTS